MSDDETVTHENPGGDYSYFTVGKPLPFAGAQEGEIGVAVYEALSWAHPSFPAAAWITFALGSLDTAKEEDAILAPLDLAQLDILIGKLAAARKLIVEAGKKAPAEMHERSRGGFHFHEFRRAWKAPDGVAELAADLAAWASQVGDDPLAAFEAATFACGCGWRGLGVDVGRHGPTRALACPRCFNRDGNQPAEVSP